MRINQFLAKNGWGARRKVEEIILSGRVKVNGNTLTDLSYRVEEGDNVLVDGKNALAAASDLRSQILAFHKPKGYLTSHEDKHNENLIFDLLPEAYKKFNYAGRLDLDSRGLILLSNDGGFIQKITHPSFKIEKDYIVTLNKAVEVKSIAEEFTLGVREGGETLRAFKVQDAFPKPGKTQSNHLRVTLLEGKKRQIRRMFHSKHLSVIDLFRTRIGRFDLEKVAIEEGSFLEISEDDII
ncbi:pseudouridylate synthase [Leptospira ryugenii]|uniref:Pseudouridine synthase n=1 Tax=Leptospira ryugenii TaxID=1917863 RepID=A0A2P2DXL1_9LEPT|nr:pseudouridine synthase [Leptospira ryugenii]GBF49367.1 pseudouridylate synthase [Leptospira ryugenii]